MKLSQRDRRAVALLAGAVAIWGLLALLLPGRSESEGVRAAQPVPEAEKHLARLRRAAEAAPAQADLLQRVSAELAEREKGVIQADTGAQALAQLLQAVRRVAKSLAPPLETKTAELGQITPLGADYGEVQISVTFECRIEELVNLLAELTRQPEIMASRELRISPANAKEKTLNVRLTVGGVVPRRLVPTEKKGAF